MLNFSFFKSKIYKMKKIIPFSLLLIVGIALNLISSACGTGPEKTTQIHQDAFIATRIDSIFTKITDSLVLAELMNDSVTTFILVRHAEKMIGGSDPELSAAGQARAVELSRILKKIPLAKVFSTDFNRTRETARPTAEEQMQVLQLYNPSDLNTFVDHTLLNFPAKKMLVVGHSNSTASLLNILVGENIYADIPETDFDNLYLVTVFEKGRSDVVHMKYGE